MAFDGIVTRAMAIELSDALTDGKVERIYQPEKDELVFFVHTANGKKKFYTSCNNNHAGVYLTEENYTNPAQPSSFCMLMRKHLVSARITSVHQKDAERIIEMEFETRDEMGYSVTKKMIIEIMGKHSNVVLIDTGSGRIIDSLKRISIDVSRARQVLPGGTYEYPPQQDKVPFDEIGDEELDAMRGDPDAILASVQGISPLISRELADSPSENMHTLLGRLERRDLTPRVYLKDDRTPADFHVIPIREYSDRYRSLDFDSVSAAAAYYFEHRDSGNRVRQKASGLTKSVSNALKKLYLKKQRLSEDLLKAENSEKYHLYGELLTANIHNFKTGDREVTVTNYYDGSDITIPLDKRFAPAKNAQNYFKKYSKAKTAQKEKKIQLQETDQDITYLESVASFIESAEDTDAIDAIREELTELGYVRKRRLRGPRKKRKAKPYEYHTSDGFRVLAGHNNKENDQLTFRMAGKHDLWFHTKDIPGSHVILFTEGREVSDSAIFEAAAIAAYHSKARNSENVPVDCTLVRHVKKPNGAKPGMCIFTDNRTVFITPGLPGRTDTTAGK
ncbi:MAG: Rqc2 family fibronectin-binding protein [Anaerovoracaceae bacterium]|jgi:predicted ribosome quality control (RQC) complex YloA/Tae2 family protein